MQPLTLTQQDWTRFLTPEGLAEKSGVPSHAFRKMILKEFVDNAMDTGSPVTVDSNGDDCVVISDQGDGINLDAYDIKRPLQSSKHWRTGKRGALGNGLRAAMGALYCLDGYLDVETRGSHTRLRVATSGDVQREVLGASDWVGTRLTVHCPEIATATAFAKQALDHPGDSITAKRAAPKWFDVDAIIDLQRSAEGVTVVDFCRQFHTRYKPGNPSQFVTEVNPATLLGNMLSDAMQEPKVKPLGNLFDGGWSYVGEYVKETGTFSVGNATLPFVIEVWGQAETGSGEIETYAPLINRTNSLTGLGIYRQAKGRVGMHVGGQYRALPKPERDSLTLRGTVDYKFTVAITAPYVPILSSGKRPDLQNLAIPIMRCVAKAGRKAHNGLKRKVKGMTIREAVTTLLPDAYARVSDNGKYWANVRQLMYEMRPDILRMCGREKFSDGTVTQNYIPDFLDANPKMTAAWRIAYDKRGHLTEPHTRGMIGLGTVEVANYTSKRERIAFDRHVNRVDLLSRIDPQHRFGGLLFVEKEGFSELIYQSGILERFDLALASTKGMSVTAARALIDDLAGRSPLFKVYVMTDFDITGQSILHTLTNDTARYTFRNHVNAVHIGLDWDRAEELHDAGRSEPIEAKDRSKDADRLRDRGLCDDAIDFLTDDDEPRRVELNALRPAEFIQLLESGLGYPEKVIPPENVLADAWCELSIKLKVQEYEAELRSGSKPSVPDYQVIHQTLLGC